MTDDQPAIYGAMARVLEELPAIGKNQRNAQQGFQFRGIDDVLNALNPLLAKHGVFYVPDVIERIEGTRQVGSGKAMYVVNLHVQYTFFANDGSSVIATGWGEGTDMGDKATNKAMTAAMKYVLFQTFAIATADNADSDATTVEESVPVKGPSPQDKKAQGLGYDDAAHMKRSNDALKQLLSDADKENPLAAADFRGWLDEQGHKKPPLPADVMAEAIKWWKDEGNTKPSGSDDEEGESA